MDIWNIGYKEHWLYGTLDIWNTGYMEHWILGTLDIWNIGLYGTAWLSPAESRQVPYSKNPLKIRFTTEVIICALKNLTETCLLG